MALTQFYKTLLWPVRSSFWLKNIPKASRVCAVSLQLQRISTIDCKYSVPSVAGQYGNKLAIVDLKEQVSYKCLLERSFALKGKVCDCLMRGYFFLSCFLY